MSSPSSASASSCRKLSFTMLVKTGKRPMSEWRYDEAPRLRHRTNVVFAELRFAQVAAQNCDVLARWPQKANSLRAATRCT